MKTSLSNRQRLIAFYVACGRRNKEIAEELGVSSATISIAKRSPLFQVLVRQHQKDIVDHGIKSTVDQVLADGAANVRFLRRLRDGDDELLAECDDKMMRLRLGAASELLSRQMPRVRESEQRGVQVNIVVDGIQRGLADASCREVGAPIVTEAKLLPPPTQDTGWFLRQLDEVVEEFEQADAADG